MNKNKPSTHCAKTQPRNSFRLISAYSSDEIIKVISDCLHIKKDMIVKKQSDNIYRKLAVYPTKQYTNLSLKEIGKLFDMNYATASVSSNVTYQEFERIVKNVL